MDIDPQLAKFMLLQAHIPPFPGSKFDSDDQYEITSAKAFVTHCEIVNHGILHTLRVTEEFQ